MDGTPPLGRVALATFVTLSVLCLKRAPAAFGAPGDLDHGFDGDGIVTTLFRGSVNNVVTTLAVQDDGMIVAGGGLSLARYDADGVLDPAFGNGGAIETVALVVAAAVQDDHKIVTIGTVKSDATADDFIVARYNEDGSLDTGFGNGGTVVTDFFGGVDQGRAILIQPDHKIVVGGMAHDSTFTSGFGLVRYDENGTPDSGFGTDGKTGTKFFSNTVDQVEALLLQPADQKIVAVGFTRTFGASDFALARFDSSGQIDPEFGTGGQTVTDFFGYEDEAHGAAFDGDDIVVAGRADVSSFASDFGVARYGADGVLDAAFGGDGLVTTDFGDDSEGGYGVVVQADHKVIAGGYSLNGGLPDFAAVRLLDNGDPDPAFGIDGEQVLDIAGMDDYAYAVALQSGKALLGGSAFTGATGSDFTLVRLDTAGDPDAAFGVGGIVTTDLLGPEQSRIRAVAIQYDDKIVAAGTAGDSVSTQNFALSRYLADGSIDVDFGNQGFVTTDFFGSSDEGYAITIQDDHKIVVAGTTHNGPDTDFAVARYDEDGSLDAGFGSGGRAAIDIEGKSNDAFGVTIDPGHDIVVVGRVFNPSGTNDFGVVRLDATGVPDPGFGTGGSVVTDLFGKQDEAYSVVVQDDLRIVVCGITTQGTATGFDFGVVRYLSNGDLDSDFAGGGIATVDFGNSVDSAAAVALDANQRIVVAGFAGSSAAGDFGVARLTSDGSPDVTFDGDGQLRTDVRGAGSGDEGAALAIRDGKIVVAGCSGQSGCFSADTKIAVARYDDGGGLDAAFGDGGIVTTPIGTFSRARAVAIQNDGKIVAAGEALVTATSPGQFALARYSNSDTSSGTCGDPTEDARVSASDALSVLRTAVGLQICLLCVCDVNNSGTVTASDALNVLKKAVGQDVALDCPAC
jgi:uncharacterized delta-60 repeat protein